MAAFIRRTVLLAVLTLAAGVSCKELSVTSPPVASVTIVPDGAALLIGQTVLFIATLRDADGNELRRTVTWTSSADAVATVSNDGRVTALGPGTAMITAAADGRSDQVEVTVNVRPVATVDVTPPQASLEIGDSVQFQATARTADGEVVAGKVAAWSSSDPGIAQVRPNGWARALAVGTSSILATIDGVRGEATLSVRAAVIAVSNVEIEPATMILALGDTMTFVARITAADGSPITGRAPTWSSTNPGVADVSDAGRVTARSAGTALIRATVDGVTGEAAVSVSTSGVATIAIAPPSVTMAIGMVGTMQATLRSSSGSVITGVNVTWTSSNTTVATITSTGQVTARSVGSTTITASADGKSGTAMVFVVAQPVTSITITPATPDIFVGDTLLLTAILVDANGDTLNNRSVSWGSGNTGVALAEATGPSTQRARLIGQAAGSALISASTESRSDTTRATVRARADLLVTKTTATPLVKAGDTVNFTLFVRNNGPSPAAAVVITDTLPTNVTFVSATGNPTQSGNVLTWPTIGNLAVNGTRSFTIRMVAPASGGFTNVGAARTTTTERDLTNNRATAAVSVNPPNLTVKKTASAATVNAGGSITYTIEISNGGASPAALVAVIDSLPPSATFVSASNGGTLNGTVVTWPTIASINVGQPVTYTVNVTAPLTGGTLTNVARATSPSGDTDPSDNRSEVSVAVNAVADLVVTKTANVAAVGPGEIVGYTITVRNAGPSPAANVVVTDNLPAPPATVVVPSINPPGSINSQTNVLTWPAITSLASGATATFQVSVTAGPSGSVVNTASATSPTADPNQANNTSTVTTPIRQADLQITKSGPGSVNAASPITWIIVVTNAGPDTAFDVTVRDTLPAGASFTSATPTESAQSGRVVLWNVASIAPGDVRMFTLNGVAPASGGTAVNRARVTAMTGDPDASNNRATASTTIVPVANLGVTKTGTVAVNPGGSITWEIVVSNAGPSAAAAVTLTDNLPVGVDFVSANPTPTNVNGQVITWDAGSVPANGSLPPFSLTVQVDPAAAAGALSNSATVSSTTTDPDNVNNTATFQTTITVANLEVTLAGPGAALETDPLNYTVKVKNVGASAAAGVVVTYTFGGAATFVTSNPLVSPAGGVLAWNVASPIAAGDSALFTVTLMPTAGGGTVNNAASATTTTFDGDPSNDAAALATNVNPAANLGVTMVAAPDPVSAGDIVTYTITVSNAGPSLAQSVQVDVTVPGVGTFVDATGGVTPSGLSLQFSAFDLASSDNAVLTYRWNVPAAGSLSSNVIVSAATADPVPANNSVTAAPAIAGADLGIGITAPAAVTGGATFDYVITVTNNGPGRAMNLVVTSPVPSNAMFVSALPAPIATNPLTWNVAQLDPGEDTTFIVSLTAPLLGDVSMTAAVSGATSDPVAGNNTVSPPVVTTVNPLASDLEIKVTPSASDVAAGGTITYTIDLTNNGPGLALTVQLDGSVTNGTITGGSLPVTYLAMGVGEVQTVILTVTAGTAGTPLTLSLTATAATPDPNGATATVNTPVT